MAGLGAFWLSGHSIDLPKLPQEKALFFLNTTASLPQGLYMRIPNWFLRDGDYVAYVPTKETAEVAVSRGWLQINELLLKKIGAMPGEGYDINPSTMQFSVQGRYLGQVFAEDREGNAMPAHYGKHVVPSRDFLPVGTSWTIYRHGADASHPCKSHSRGHDSVRRKTERRFPCAISRASSIRVDRL